MNINWKQKLSSRKFWSLLAAFIGAVLVFMNASPESVERVAAIIAAAGAVVGYMFAEANVDAGRVSDVVTNEQNKEE